MSALPPALLASDPAAQPAGLVAALGADGGDLGLLALRAVVQHKGWGLGIKDARSGRYTEANVALAQLFGCSLSDLLSHADADLLDPGLASLLRAADQTALAQGQSLASDHKFELRGERRDFTVLRVVGGSAEHPLLCCIWQDMAPQRQRDAQTATRAGPAGTAAACQ